MKSEKILGIIICVLLLSSCHQKRTFFPKGLETQDIEIVRFDNALMNVHEATVATDIRVLYDEYPVFMPLWVEDIIGIPSADTAFLENSYRYSLMIQRTDSKPPTNGNKRFLRI